MRAKVYIEQNPEADHSPISFLHPQLLFKVFGNPTLRTRKVLRNIVPKSFGEPAFNIIESRYGTTRKAISLNTFPYTNGVERVNQMKTYKVICH